VERRPLLVGRMGLAFGGFAGLANAMSQRFTTAAEVWKLIMLK
jgi:hypothetical protein